MNSSIQEIEWGFLYAIYSSTPYYFNVTAPFYFGGGFFAVFWINNCFTFKNNV